MVILTISAVDDDSVACLLVDSEIIAAPQEERFTRIKHDKSFPTQSINFCLAQRLVSASQIDLVCFMRSRF